MTLLKIIFQVILGLLIGDIVAGAAHWFEDTYFDYCTTIPVISDIARENELHHYFPRTILEGSYFDNIKLCASLICVLFFILFFFIPKTMIGNPFLFIPIFIAACLANLFHRFSHERECETPPFIYKLQKMGVLVSHEHHREHHANEVDGKYCPIFPITNYILDTIYFWRFIEFIIAIFGMKPSRKPSYNHYAPIQNHMHEDAKKKCPKRPQQKDIDELYDNLDDFMKCNAIQN